MSMWLMYLILKLDIISNSLIIISILGFVLPAFILIIVGAEDSGDMEDTKKVWKIVKRIWLCMIFLFLFFIFIPTTKQAAAIYFVPKVINNKQVRKMPDKLVTLANDWMDEQIKIIKGAKDA